MPRSVAADASFVYRTMCDITVTYVSAASPIPDLLHTYAQNDKEHAVLYPCHCSLYQYLRDNSNITCSACLIAT